jgi:hypothetical protein
MKSLALALAALLATPVIAAEELPIEGEWGDNCNDPETYLTADEYSGVGYSCRYAWASEKVEGRWSVIATCQGDGYPISQLLAIEAGREGMMLSTGHRSEDVVLLKRCK